MSKYFDASPPVLQPTEPFPDFRRPWAAYQKSDSDYQKWWRDRFDRLMNDAEDLPDCEETTRLKVRIVGDCELAVRAAGRAT